MKRIITFYSYKGGTGRSLLVANTAKFFAYCGYKVFVIDFDLEAPGMHYKFKVEPNKLGLIDYILRNQERSSCSLNKYVQKIQLETEYEGEIIFMPAGNAPSIEYADKLSQIKWDQLFSSSSESETINVPVIEDLIKKIRKDYKPDFILVDSRTGLTDIGAITIRFMADQLVCLYHYNEESKDGVDLIIKTVKESNDMDQNYKIDIIKVLTRVPEKVNPDEIILRSEPNLEITEELKFNLKKSLGESVLLRDYLNFFALLEPDIKLNPKIQPIYERRLPDEIERRKSDPSPSIKERIGNRGEPLKNKLKLANSKYIGEENFQKLIDKIVDRLKKQNRLVNIEKILDENINWHMLGIQMREGVFDFCGDPFYLTKTRSHLVNVVQFGWLEAYTIYLMRDSKAFEILMQHKNDPRTDLLAIMKEVDKTVENLQIGTIGDHAASSEAYTILSQYLKGTAFLPKYHEKELWEWIDEKPEKRMIICDHVIAEKFESIQNELNRRKHRYAFDEEFLTFKFKERIPVGFLYPSEDIEWRREISRAFSQALFYFLKDGKDIWGDKSTDDTISHELKKVHIEPFSFDELWKNLVWDLPLKDANEWSRELSKIRNKEIK